MHRKLDPTPACDQCLTEMVWTEDGYVCTCPNDSAGRRSRPASPNDAWKVENLQRHFTLKDGYSWAGLQWDAQRSICKSIVCSRPFMAVVVRSSFKDNKPVELWVRYCYGCKTSVLIREVERVIVPSTNAPAADGPSQAQAQ